MLRSCMPKRSISVQFSMSAAKVKEREGHGYEYPVRGSVVNLGSPVHGAGYLMPALAGYRQ